MPTATPLFKARSVTSLIDTRARKCESSILGLKGSRYRLRRLTLHVVVTPRSHIPGENPDDQAVHTGAAEFGDELRTLT